MSLTGQFTHWVQGTSTASFGAGITVATLTVNSATSATAVLNIDPAAAAGARNVTVTTGGGSGHVEQRLHGDQRDAGADHGESEHGAAGADERIGEPDRAVHALGAGDEHGELRRGHHGRDADGELGDQRHGGVEYRPGGGGGRAQCDGDDRRRKWSR